MDFGFSEEQDQLRQEVRRFLDERCPLSEVRRIMETPSGCSEELWREMAELGWLGLTIPEAYGGAGLGWVDLVILLEETGRSLYPSPLISNTLAVTAILEVGSDEPRSSFERLAPGSQRSLRNAPVVPRHQGLRGAKPPKLTACGGRGLRLNGRARFRAVARRVEECANGRFGSVKECARASGSSRSSQARSRRPGIVLSHLGGVLDDDPQAPPWAWMRGFAWFLVAGASAVPEA